MARATDRYIAQNRRARHDYFIDETVEAGIVLTGTEVKSLRGGKASLNESYATDRGGEIWLLGANIPVYPPASRFNHDPKRARKLLLRRREMDRLLGASTKEGATLVPLGLYFSPRGIAKVELGVARGKKRVDKRQAIKDRDWKRDKARIMKARG